MPPKSAPDEASANTDVKILIELMHSATEFKADTSQMAAICGLSAAKNVPRKINSIIGPFGYEFRGGKIVSKDGSDNDKAIKSTNADGKAPKTPKTPKTPKAPRAKSAKKRKIEEELEAEDDGIEVDGGEVGEDAVKEEVVMEDADRNSEEA